MEVGATCLDVCCGGKMIWFNKNDKRALFLDNRTVDTVLCDGRSFVVKPDSVADFRNLPFADNTFPLVVFDPPHLTQAGETSWLRTKYGVLGAEWKNDLRQGFNECFRVLIPLGTLVFKWSEVHVNIADVLALSPSPPLFGNRRGKTIWCVFQKDASSEFDLHSREQLEERINAQYRKDFKGSKIDAEVMNIVIGSGNS